jgi:hypothetical protein
MPVMLERWNDDKMDALDARVDGLAVLMRKHRQETYEIRRELRQELRELRRELRQEIDSCLAARRGG